MPSGVVSLPNGRRVRVNAPTREKLLEVASQIASGARGVQPNSGVDPNTGEFNEDLAAIDSLANRAAAGNVPTEPRDLGVAGNVARTLRSIPKETSLPLVGATLASVAFPPLAAARAASMVPGAMRLASAGRTAVGNDVTLPILGSIGSAAGRRAVSMAPPVAAAAAGGAAGGAAAESDDPDATADSIARAAIESGGEMAMAELVGLGLSSAAARAVAPNLKFLDPLKGIRESVSKFVGENWPKGMTAGELGKAWGRLTQAQKAKLPQATREAIEEIGELGERMQRSGMKAVKFAATPAGGEVAEILTVPAIALFFGPGPALAFSVGKALLHPGPITRYLTRDKLPDEATRALGRQAVTTEARRRAVEDDQ